MKRLIWLLIGILLGIILTGIVVWNVMPGQMIRVVKSAYGFDETVSMIQEAAFQNDWEVLHVYDFE
ncbi:MAG: hypothetical protein JW996_05655, partial [Candidatus Cloacimonetes bacterium]|nr:hypothetical protein [Candidatus Cloacimonadota bacterium]